MRLKRLAIRWRFGPFLLFAGALGVTISASAQTIPAFPGAEGWGAITPGGRGGQVIHVTNLNDSGPGSFRAALTASGPRTVVFDVAGQINLLSEVSVSSPYLTIAGQTAPGDGITIAGETTSLDTHDIVVRYLRFRRGATDGNHRDDALGSDRTTGNIIIDHVSASWGLDENMSVYRNKLDQPIVPGGSTVLPARNITIQWSISSEALNPFNHAFGSTLGGAGVNFHHNLWASNTGRNPSISFSHFMDFRNNVLFNWQHRSVDGAGPEAHVNMVNNYYKSGPATNSGQLMYRIVKPELRNGVVGYGEAGWWYVEGNFVNGFPNVTANNWNGGVQFDLIGMQESWVRVHAPHTHVEFPDDPDDPNDDVNGVPIPIPDLPTVATQTAQDAYQWVLDNAGASLVRDAVDVRITNSAATGIASAGPNGNGIITDISQVGGYPVIPFVQRGPDYDTDQDGMPNDWESDHGLNPANAADRNDDIDADGYSNLEEYFNDLGAFKAVEDVVWDGGNGRYALIDNWNIAFQPSRLDTAVINNGTVTVDAVGQHAGTLKIATHDADAAQLNITGGWLLVHDAVVIGATAAAQGTLNLSGGELTTGTLSKGAASAFNFTGGMLHADTVAFSLINNGGTLAPGHSPGLTHVMGNLILNSGVLEIEIGGTAFGQFDRLLVDGFAQLGGTLKVDLVDLGTGPFVPQLGDSFGFLAALGGAGDMFDAFDLPDLGPDLQWALQPGDETVFLTVVSAALAGDFNDDGVVDAVDYTMWRDNFGSTTNVLANETASLGVVDDADYDAWKANFGATSGGLGGAGSASPVPEPTSLMTMSLGSLLLYACSHALLRNAITRRSRGECFT